MARNLHPKQFAPKASEISHHTSFELGQTLCKRCMSGAKKRGEEGLESFKPILKTSEYVTHPHALEVCSDCAKTIVGRKETRG